ncbi:MAG: DNRLRE domain-containing protein [Candidatus Cloacimonadota bacterium]|nr:DNRLRE domain-containing protein [Candidatus Cloacimonadota bacterium]
MNKKFIFSIFAITLIIVACTSKKSPFGIQYDYIIESDTLLNVFSFTESYEDSIKNYYEDPTIVVGSFHDVIAKGVFRFLSLPDTTWLDSISQINTCKIRIVKRNQLGDDFNIQINKLQKQWLESTVIWDTLNNYIGEEIQTFSTAVDTSLGDTITFSFDKTVVENWIEQDTINYGIIFSAPEITNNFAEFYSAETDYAPQLQIIYTKSTGSLDTLFYDVSKDAYIAKNNNNSSLDYGAIANLPPTRMRFSLDKDSLVNLLINAISDSFPNPDPEKISINYAELIFDSTCIDSSFNSSIYLDIKPYYIIDTLDVSYSSVSGSSISDFDEDEEFFKVNITGITQGILRDSFEYNQFLLKSVYENIDFSFLRFSEDFNPKLRILFTYNIETGTTNSTNLTN